MVSHHLVAALALAGVVLDVFGGLYLAYDLFGGRSGPLRVVTRAATYGLIFVIAYVLILGAAFGFPAGLGLGVILGLEYRTGGRAPSRRLVSAYALLRGTALGLGGALDQGLGFGTLFGCLSVLGLMISYLLLRAAPSHEYPTAGRPRFRPRVLLNGVIRSIFIGLAALLAGLALGHGEASWRLALRVSAAVSLVGGLVGTAAPVVERYSDDLPPRTLGIIGALTVLIGLTAQSVQYVLALLDVRVT